TGIETRVTVLGHVQRGGTPTAYDRVLATRFGLKAVELIREKQFGYMASLRGTEIVAMPIEEALSQKLLDPKVFDHASVLFGKKPLFLGAFLVNPQRHEDTKMHDDLTPMMRQYHAVKQETPDALLLFRLGDFYELFFEDAVTASRELEITLTARNKERDNPIPMCGVPYHAADSYIARLLRKG